MPHTDTWPEELLPPYYSRMTGDTLRERSRRESGPCVFLFPALGNPILVPAPMQYGYRDSGFHRPIDIDLSPYLDLDGDRVVPLSDRMSIYARIPLDSIATLARGFVVYHCNQRLYSLPPNNALETVFINTVPIRGNVVVAMVSSDGRILDAEKAFIETARLVAAISKSYGPPPALSMITTENYYPTPLAEGMWTRAWLSPQRQRPSQTHPESLMFRPELCSLLLRNLSFLDLVAFSHVSAIFRYRVGHEIVNRWNVKLGKPFNWTQILAFFDSIQKSQALIVGGIVRDLLLDIMSPVHTMDIICAAGLQSSLLAHLQSLGFHYVRRAPSTSSDVSPTTTGDVSDSSSDTGSPSSEDLGVRDVYEFMREHVDGVAEFAGPFRVRLIYSKYSNPFRTLLNSSNSYQLNAMSGSRLHCFYPKSLISRRGIQMCSDPTFRANHPELPMDYSNADWTESCGSECPAVWQKTIGRSTKLELMWRTPVHSSSADGAELGIPPFKGEGWEDKADGLMYRLVSFCYNPICPLRENQPQ